MFLMLLNNTLKIKTSLCQVFPLPNCMDSSWKLGKNIVWRKEWLKISSDTLQCFPQVFVKMLQKCQIGGVAPTTEDTSGVNHVVVRRNNNPNILVYLDSIQTKAISIKKAKDFKIKPTLRKDLKIKKNVSSVVKRVTGLTNAQIKIKSLDLLPCFQKTWIQPGGI